MEERRAELSAPLLYLVTGPEALQVRFRAPLDGRDEVAQPVLDAAADGEPVAVRHPGAAGQH